MTPDASPSSSRSPTLSFRQVAAFGFAALISGMIVFAVVYERAPALHMQVEGSDLILDGGITTGTYERFAAMIDDHPGIERIVLGVMDGTDTEIDVFAMGRLIRRLELETHLRSHSEIYSGAVDLFAAGATRSMERGAVVGVHSWSDGYEEGGDLPRDAPAHDVYERFFERMLGSADFYWFTLEMASYDEMHLMSEAEILRFGLLTEPIR